MTPLAHSPRAGIPPQPYRKHIDNVREQAVRNAANAAAYYTGDREAFVGTVEAAAVYHDLGKLDASNQQVLRRKSFDPLPVKHEDAGVAALLRWSRLESVVLVAAHHAGLFSQEREIEKGKRIFRDLRVAEHVDVRLDDYVTTHAAAGCPTLGPIEKRPLHLCGLTRRLALSCLVDADHSDTARNYGQEVEEEVPERRWQERLDALDRFVHRFPEGDSEPERRRNQQRRWVYEACRAATMDPPMRACDAPVGSGKTTAVMAHLLRAAQSKELRHIFVVLPYTNIIKQAVDVYRRALVLPGEHPEDVIAEHHHQADFADLTIRQLATLWRAPIIVTTAVQFFETLASHHPGRLRKLHELPGSAVFVDETHAAIPSHLWPQVWRWLETWTWEWGGHVVLASGSLPRFWELREFVDPPKSADDVPDLVPDFLRRELETAEKSRILPHRRTDPLDCRGLIDWVNSGNGDSRLLILNTVQSAAVVAAQMRKIGHDVLHLSTALAPIHRERIVEQVKERLKCKVANWTLVATSCVEAGMDFSFRKGFRESCSTASLIQVGGRVSRGAEYSNAELWDFRTLDPMLTAHPGFTISRRVLDDLFEKNLLATLSPSAAAKEAMRREVTAKKEEQGKTIQEQEKGMEYPEVARLCQVIDADTRVVVIDPGLVKDLRSGKKISSRHLLRHSVQLWASKVVDLALTPVFPKAWAKDDPGTLYEWTLSYDPAFLGCMAGVLPLLEGKKTGLFLV
jgi:CRISPR-associated endonuclease/helicase Cas3